MFSDFKSINKINISLILIILSLVFMHSCSSINSYDDNSFPVDCLKNEAEILNQPGSEDAPKLGIGIGIEDGIQSLNWTSIDYAIYYELEFCGCPDFSYNVRFYEMEGCSFTPEQPSPYYYYYRVRSVLQNGYTTGWSNIVKLDL